MKKGIIMEQHRKYTIVMTNNGLFEKAHPIKDTDIGFEVEYEPLVQKQWGANFKEKLFTMRVAALACVFLLALLPLYMVANGNETYAYVDIDINPSIELEIDNDLEISNATPLNQDARMLLREIGDIEGKTIEDAVEIIINKSEKRGLINTAKNILIGVHYLKDGEKDSVTKTIENHFAKKTTEWKVVTVVIPEEVRATAEKNKQSMNQALANTVAKQVDKQMKSIVSEEEKEVLQSFFNKSKKEVEITIDEPSDIDEPSKNDKPSISEKPAIAADKSDEKGKSRKDVTHPSELKGKNGEINSNKNGNGRNNGKAMGHEKDKFNNGNNKNKDKFHHDKGKKNKDEDKFKHKAKHKDHPRGKDKKDKDNKGNNGNKGKGNNGHKGNNGNGKGNGNKGNHDNGKNVNDDYSFIYPKFK